MGPVSSRQRHTQRTHQLVIYTFVCFFLRVWFECSNNICADKRQKRMCRNTYFFFFFSFCVWCLFVSHFRLPVYGFNYRSCFVIATETVYNKRRTYLLPNCCCSRFSRSFSPSISLFTVWHDRRVQGTNVDSSVQRTHTRSKSIQSFIFRKGKTSCMLANHHHQWPSRHSQRCRCEFNKISIFMAHRTLHIFHAKRHGAFKQNNYAPRVCDVDLSFKWF